MHSLAPSQQRVLLHVIHKHIQYDDFVATHINQTLEIHYSGIFLAWHRYFTYIYETALRDECGYTGTQPYWDWPLYSSSPQTSPIFNGDDYSMSGNGEFIPGHPGLNITIPGVPNSTVLYDPGLGGGCVTEGPFKDMVVNLGPVSLPGASVGPDGGLGYNPRCLKRDLGPGTAKFVDAAAVSVLQSQTDIWDFEMTMQGFPGSGTFGVHGGGHYTIAGDPGGDVFTSPGDPAFFLHHGNIDRMWWIWQNADLEARQNAISGTGTFLNTPPSANTTLQTEINLGFAGGETIAMADLMSTTAGPFCYTYE